MASTLAVLVTPSISHPQIMPRETLLSERTLRMPLPVMARNGRMVTFGEDRRRFFSPPSQSSPFLVPAHIFTTALVHFWPTELHLFAL